jgi:hypothetical protein
MPQLHKHFNVSRNFMSRLFYIVLLTALTFHIGAKSQQKKETLINGKHYKGLLDRWGFYLFGAKEDTILNLPGDDFVSFEFKDFNKDGYKDIFLEWGGNIPERFSLYVFVSSTGKFKELHNFSDFPAAAPVEGTRYYYSYYRAGCADNAWGSHLFYIKNNNAIKVGNIRGEGCGIKEGIYIYKLSGNKKELVKTLPLNVIEKYKDYKWGFIRQFWSKNYSTFL